jgi:hypothetical protein
VPDQPSTPHRTFRAPDEEWEPAKRIAADRGETLTDVLRRALRRYIREFGDDQSDDASS